MPNLGCFVMYFPPTYIYIYIYTEKDLSGHSQGCCQPTLHSQDETRRV